MCVLSQYSTPLVFSLSLSILIPVPPSRVQLIKTTRPGLSLPPPPDLTPKLRPAFLEILALGIRGMQPYEMLPMQMPYMQIEVKACLAGSALVYLPASGFRCLVLLAPASTAFLCCTTDPPCAFSVSLQK